MGFVHDEDFTNPDFTPQDIRDCTDTEQLRDWLEELEDARGDIKSQIEAAQVTGLIDKSWLERSRGAFAFSSMGAKRVKRRLRELGVSPEAKDEFTNLLDRLNRQTEELSRERQSASFGRHLLASLRAGLPEAGANAIIREASDRVMARKEAA